MGLASPGYALDYIDERIQMVSTVLFRIMYRGSVVVQVKSYKITHLACGCVFNSISKS